MRRIESEKIPIILWLDHIDPGAMEQAKNLANLPFAFSHIAIMPDAHQGYGMPIGGVLATKGVVIPNAVGVDIGCGICAIKTSLRDISKTNLRSVIKKTSMVVPVGFSHHKKSQEEKLMPPINRFSIGKGMVINIEYENALKQLGTLGGGNHFIEIQNGSDGFIWIMVHSGSRNFGYKVAEHYNKLARELNKKRRSLVQKKWDLAYFIPGSEEEKKYLLEMNYSVEFAFANRKLIMERVKEVFSDEFKGKIEFNEFINIAHNYASKETHFGTEVIVHRKGATSARKGERGIIPGSQGTRSFIVRGKGNKDSFMSCSHGAGRKLGRKQAIRELDLRYEVEKLEKMGIIHSLRSQRDLDEASSAYKDIEEVMENQRDLVEIEIELSPLGVIKG